MSNAKKILIVDDHPFIIEAYKNAIRAYHEADANIMITQAHDCKSGYEYIMNAKGEYDLAFFDISMPEYPEKDIRSGEDLAKLMREQMPNCRVVLLTMHTELLKIQSILNNVNPDGLIIKNDLTFDELLSAFEKIFNNEKYYSLTVIKLIGQLESENIDLDQFDKQIIYHLSKGIKTKNIPTYLPLSLSAVEKRKLNIKEVLNVKGGTDVDLIREAKAKGII